MKAAEQILDESVIYVTKQGSVIRIDGGRIKIWDTVNEEEITSFPVKKVDTINIFGNINFTTPFIRKASEEEITLNYFSSHGKYRGSFIPKKNTIAEIRKDQYGLDEKEKLEISKSIIRGKIENSITLLKRKNIREINEIKEILESIRKISSFKKLRSYEGEGHKLYYNHLDESLIEGWEFNKRTKYPPKDHINSLLSLTYTMVKNEVITSLRQYNLDPFIGIMHVDRHGRPALALDLLEEFRPIFCDAFSIRLINRKTLSHDSFKQNNRLKEDQFKKYLNKFEEYMQEEFKHPHFGYRVTRRKSVKMQAILLRKAITGEMERYHPLVFKR